MTIYKILWPAGGGGGNEGDPNAIYAIFEVNTSIFILTMKVGTESSIPRQLTS